MNKIKNGLLTVVIAWIILWLLIEQWSMQVKAFIRRKLA